jgi:hypothetical protein
MATREHRVAEFSTGTPTDGLPVELLCQDHAGTYVLPLRAVGLKARGTTLTAAR